MDRRHLSIDVNTVEPLNNYLRLAILSLIKRLFSLRRLRCIYYSREGTSKCALYRGFFLLCPLSRVSLSEVLLTPFLMNEGEVQKTPLLIEMRPVIQAAYRMTSC